MKKIFKFLIIFPAILLFSCGEDCKFNAITNESLKDAVVGQEYYEKLNYDITCSYASKYAEIADGALPPGIVLEGTGEFTGIATSAGEYTFIVEMTICFSSNGFQYTDCTERKKEFTIEVNEE